MATPLPAARRTEVSRVMATNQRSAKRRVEALLARSWQPGRRGRVAVLCYHSIHPTLPFASATPRLFREHLRWLGEHCDVVSLSALTACARSRSDARPLVAITFDDGYEDNYTHAYPALVDAKFPATIFVTTGLIAAEPDVIRTFCDLYDVAPGDVTGLSWEQMREMQRRGVEFGAHTHTHPNLAYIGATRALAEIRTSKSMLEDRLERPVTSFAYPFGKPRFHFDARTVGVVAGLGFENAVAIHYRGVRPGDDKLRIPRFAVTNDPVDVLAAKIHGKLDVLGLWQELAPLSIARLVANDPSLQPDARRRMQAAMDAPTLR